MFILYYFSYCILVYLRGEGEMATGRVRRGGGGGGGRTRGVNGKGSNNVRKCNM